MFRRRIDNWYCNFIPYAPCQSVTSERGGNEKLEWGAPGNFPGPTRASEREVRKRFSQSAIIVSRKTRRGRIFWQRSPPCPLIHLSHHHTLECDLPVVFTNTNRAVWRQLVPPRSPLRNRAVFGPGEFDCQSGGRRTSIAFTTPCLRRDMF